MKSCSENNSVERLLERVNLDTLSIETKSSLELLGLLQSQATKKPHLAVPTSVAKLPDWDRVGAKLDKRMECFASMGLLCRLLNFREFLREKCEGAAWRSSDFLQLAYDHISGTQPIARESISVLGSGKTLSTDIAVEFDTSLRLACCHFLTALMLNDKSLGLAAADCCRLYIKAIDILDRQVKHPGVLPEPALVAARNLLCDEQWNVVDGRCNLPFREACQAMIRAIQIAVLETLISQAGE